MCHSCGFYIVKSVRILSSGFLGFTEVVCVSEYEYLEIVKKLIPGSYSTSTGYPGAEEAFTEFVKDITERIPELRNLELGKSF
jgi:hypothetical protein